MVYDDNYVDFDDLMEEEQDAFCRRKKQNGRKSMLPLFVYLILKEDAKGKPMRQKDILKRLEAMPYEVAVERKALSRVLHNLEDSMLGVECDLYGRGWSA